MAQQKLTAKQMDIVKKLNVLFKRAKDAQIAFFVDYDSNSFIAANAIGIDYFDHGDGDEEMDWDKTEYILVDNLDVFCDSEVIITPVYK